MEKKDTKENFKTAIISTVRSISNIHNLEEALTYISQSVEISGYNLGKEIFISIDAAASELYKDNLYTLKGENNAKGKI